jgi:hypothetical protein
MTEKEYRQYKADSYTTLKDFDNDRKKYYRKYVAQEDVREREDEEESKAATIGSLVDCLLLDPDSFDDKFFVSACINPPTGLMSDFVEALYKRTRDSVNEEGRLTKEFSSLMLEAYNDVKFDRDGNVVAFKRDSFEKVVEKFTGDVKTYYEEICRVRPNKLTVITTSEIAQAEKVKNELRTNAITSQVVNLVSNSRFTVYNQFAIIFTLKSLELKSLIDKLVIDHEEKTIQPYDLKVTWDAENFYENYYLYRKTYLQAGLYHIALMNLKKQPEYKDYTILPMQFIVVDPNVYMSPLIYKLSEDNLSAAYTGFNRKWRKYNGLESIISDLQWHKETGIWTISKKNHENKGIVNLNDELND